MWMIIIFVGIFYSGLTLRWPDDPSSSFVELYLNPRSGRNITVCLQKYMSYPSTIKPAKNFSSVVRFPKITACLNSMHSKRKLLAKESFSTFFQSFEFSSSGRRVSETRLCWKWSKYPWVYPHLKELYNSNPKPCIEKEGCQDKDRFQELDPRFRDLNMTQFYVDTVPDIFLPYCEFHRNDCKLLWKFRFKFYGYWYALID